MTIFFSIVNINGQARNSGKLWNKKFIPYGRFGGGLKGKKVVYYK